IYRDDGTKAKPEMILASTTGSREQSDVR
ncbi:MAG: hypothetical protein QOI81_722, partial [Actinomycetota bacterium]|nr:hypothetical protein [Actinomycetota bacterium]